MRSPAKKLSVTIAATGVLLAASVAFAAWTASGTGTGTAKAITAQALNTIDASGTTTAQLYPGATGDLRLTINNPNPYPVKVTSVGAGSGSITSDKGTACDASTGVTFSPQSGLALNVPASSQASFTLTGAVAMSNASDDTCQGALFTIPITITGASNA